MQDVALEYAERGVSNQTAIMFEVQMGMVDRGADIGWLSQCPAAPPSNACVRHACHC